ncbi:unnamed protein product [Parnassius mnemosyne]|uniref:Uncharacterized protein n=1 Tax=Parnassius mnemosyne TaxID=213953 RepID=A0AAV1KD12_9NEOP
MKATLLLLMTSMYLVDSIPPPHPAVVAVREEEEHLPTHLRSPALHNPHLQEILPLTSLLHSGEKPVYHREADSVSRREIYDILTHAGLFPRQPGLPPPSYYNNQRHNKSRAQHEITSPQHFDVPFLSSTDLLQYL